MFRASWLNCSSILDHLISAPCPSVRCVARRGDPHSYRVIQIHQRRLHADVRTGCLSLWRTCCTLLSRELLGRSGCRRKKSFGANACADAIRSAVGADICFLPCCCTMYFAYSVRWRVDIRQEIARLDSSSLDAVESSTCLWSVVTSTY